MGIVETIRGLCEERKISIAGLEKILGLGNGTIRRWDEKLPSTDKIIKVADFFGVPLDSLLQRGSTEENKAQNSTEKRLLLLARKAADVPEEQRERERTQ